jgi:hypothetical protein
VEELGEQRERLTRLVADLHELPKRQRGALVMRELSGLSHEDIALALETSVGGAKQAIFEARQALMEFAEGRAMACDEVCRLVSDADGRVLRGRRVRAHLRECSSCSAFVAAIPARSADLRALAPPLPAIAAAGLLARIVGGGKAAGGGGIGVGGGAGFAGTLTGKGATLALATKAVAGLAVVSAATVGITRAVDQTSAVNQPPPATPVVQHHAARQLPASSKASSVAVSRIATTPAATRAFGAQGQAMSSTHSAAGTANHGFAGVRAAAPTHSASGSRGSIGGTVSRAGTVPGQTLRHSYGGGSTSSQTTTTQSTTVHSRSLQPQSLQPQSRTKHSTPASLGLIPPGL